MNSYLSKYICVKSDVTTSHRIRTRHANFTFPIDIIYARYILLIKLEGKKRKKMSSSFSGGSCCLHLTMFIYFSGIFKTSKECRLVLIFSIRNYNKIQRCMTPHTYKKLLLHRAILWPPPMRNSITSNDTMTPNAPHIMNIITSCDAMTPPQIRNYNYIERCYDLPALIRNYIERCYEPPQLLSARFMLIPFE